MAKDDGLLAAILDAPDDDAARLVYADWLEEHGEQPRADFIRVQCTLARLDVEDPYGKEHQRLEKRQEALLRKHQREWLAPLKGLAHKCTFRRGFVEEATLSARVFLGKAKALFALTPLRRVDLTEVDDPEAVAASPFLRRLTGLSISDEGSVSDDLAEALARSRHVAGLTRLELTGERDGPQISDMGAAALAASAHLGGLRVLRLPDNALGDEGVIALARSRRLKNVRELDLSTITPELGGGSLIGPAAAQALAASAALASLEVLNLQGTALDDDGAVALAGARFMATLRSLDLGFNSVGGRGAVALLESAFVARTRQLHFLTDNPVGDDGLRALAGSPALAGLTSLWLRDCGVGDEGVQALVASPHLPRLEDLILGTSFPPDDEVVHDGDCHYQADTHAPVNRITDAGARALLKCPQLADVRSLDLWGHHGIRAATRRALRKRFGDRVDLDS
jgi:uncharacterized protein (TIGR02996 family)